MASSPVAKRSILALAVLVGVCSALVGVGPGPATALSPTTGVASIITPPGLIFSSLYVRDGELFTSGTITLDNDQGVACVEARVTSSLELTDIVEPRCDDPALDGDSVIPVVTSIGKTGSGEVRLAFLAAPVGSVRIGSVLMTYQFTSGTQLEWTYGPGVLWMFEEQTGNGPEVFRVSETTGRVLQVTKIPNMLRPLISANAEGLYLAPGPVSESNYGGEIEYVGIGASRAKVVGSEPTPSGFSSWIIAGGTSLWADQCTRPAARTCTISRFEGPKLHPVFHVSDAGQTGAWVSGNETSGFYTSTRREKNLSGSPPTTEAWEIVRIDPATGATRDVTSLQLPTFYNNSSDFGPGAAIVDGGYLYVLVSGDGSSPGTLYRVAI